MGRKHHNRVVVELDSLQSVCYSHQSKVYDLMDIEQIVLWSPAQSLYSAHIPTLFLFHSFQGVRGPTVPLTGLPVFYNPIVKKETTKKSKRNLSGFKLLHQHPRPHTRPCRPPFKTTILTTFLRNIHTEYTYATWFRNIRLEVSLDLLFFLSMLTDQAQGQP